MHQAKRSINRPKRQEVVLSSVEKSYNKNKPNPAKVSTKEGCGQEKEQCMQTFS